MKPAAGNALKIGIGILIGAAFLWLALRSVDLSEVGELWGQIQVGWILLFVPIVVLSLWLRMERWKLLTEHDHIRSSRRVLFAGVMNAYAVNYAVPRLGEITRCYYVAKKEDKPVAALIGTVVLERIIDLLVLVVLMLIVVFFVITDRQLIADLLGFTSEHSTAELYWGLAELAGIGLAALILGILLFRFLAKRLPVVARTAENLNTVGRHFRAGLLSVRTIEHPALFLALTAGMWLCYIGMAGIPFALLPGSGMENLGFIDALVITVVSAVGVTIPSPGGIGTYHLFVQKALNLMYGIPESAGFTYALVSHALVFIVVIVLAPIALTVAQRRPRQGTAQI